MKERNWLEMRSRPDVKGGIGITTVCALAITVSGPSCYCFQLKFYVRHPNGLGAGQTEPHEKDPSLGVGLAGVSCTHVHYTDAGELGA